MKYKYYNINDQFIAESDSEIHFNEELFPAWQDLKVITEKPKKVFRNEKIVEEERK